MIKLSDLKLNNSNPRYITDDDFAKLKNSIKEFEKMLAIRPMLVDMTTGIVYGGNMRLRALQDLGYKEISETWVKDISHLSDDEKKELIIKDNLSYGEWDFDLLANMYDVDELEAWGLNVMFDDDSDEIDEKYTKKIIAPTYEPTMEIPPKITDLFNDEKQKELEDEIRKSDLPNEIKNFLYLASMRHVKFNYQNIAEYYAHASKEVQELFENSALVIIDFNKAIKQGFVRMAEETANQFLNDISDEV